MIISKLRSFFTNTKGVAGIEMALIMPFMLLLYFGMMDVTGLITFNRKNTASASAVADLVAQQPAQFLRSTVMDEFNAAYMIMSPSPQADVHVEVFGFRKAGSGAISQIWKVDNGAGPSCGAAISTASMGTLMAAGNDVIVARSCIIYTPYVAQFMEIGRAHV